MTGSTSRLRLAGCVAVALACAAFLPAQSAEERIAALEKTLEVAAGAERVAPLNELAAVLCRRQPARAVDLAREALALAERHADVRGAASAEKNLGLALMVLEQDEEGLAHMNSARRGFASLGERSEEARCLGYAGMMLSHVGKTWDAIASVQEALAIFRELNDDKGVAAATNNLGVMHERLGEYEEALRFNLESLRIEERLGRKIGIANNLNSVGNIHSELGEHLKARDYYRRALALFRELDEQPGVGRCLNNLGNTYEKQGDDAEALRYFGEALEIAGRIGNRGDEANARNNMGIVLKKQGKYRAAREQYAAVAEIRTALGQKQELATCLHNIAETYLLERRFAEARAAVERSVAIGREIRSNTVLDGAYLLLSQVHAERGDHRAAYEAHVLYADTRAAMLDEQRNLKIAELQERYQAEARQRQIESLSKDKELLTKDAEIRRLQLGRTRLAAALTGALALLVIGAAALLFRRYLYLLAFWKKRTFIGQYRIEREITRGGMGVIYKASNLLAPRTPVALKVIRDELAGDETQRRRFINEGKIIDTLDHPNIVKVIDRGEHNRRLYIAMEYLEGMTVAELVAAAASRGRQLPIQECLELVRQIADAAAAIHGKGIVHRDITPANVIVSGEGAGARAKLLDFGIAKQETMSTLTEVGEILGTINYMAPERLQLRDVTAASDVFSIGVLLYELLTLRKPFLAEEPVEVLKQVLGREPVRPSALRPEVSAELQDLVMAMLDKRPQARPAGTEVVERIDRLLAGAA
ncbi:MAG: tetratricopeptide repeat protein [Acidobacteriota bacterium]